MTTVVRIAPSNKNADRQRVFYLGRAYIVSQCNQDLIDLYIKKLPKSQWALQTYFAGRVSILCKYPSGELQHVLRDYDFCNPLSIDDLMSCGWLPPADVYDFSTGDVLE